MMNTRSFQAASLILLSTWCSQAFAGPQLTIKEPSFNFGMAPQNSKVSHVYWLHSTGDDTLRITEVTPGCGCTKAPLEKERLAPGDSTRLEVIFDTKNYTGLVAKSPQIATNEGETAQSVSFNCNVIMHPDSTTPVIIKPAKIDFIQVEGTPKKEVQFAISNVWKMGVDLTLVDYPAQFATVELPRSIKAGETAQAKIVFAPGTLDKEIEKSLTLQFSDDRKSRFTVPFKRIIIKPSKDTTTTSPSGK